MREEFIKDKLNQIFGLQVRLSTISISRVQKKKLAIFIIISLPHIALHLYPAEKLYCPFPV